MDKGQLVALTAELHQKLRTQARNLLFEYKYGVDGPGKKRGFVPVEAVQPLMELYGTLIAKEIWERMRQAQPHPVDVLKQLFGDKLDPETEKALRAICDAPALPAPEKQDSSC